jgi:hypothetical protein
MHPRLVGCWAKVERAKDHRLSLANEILSFNQANPGRLEGTYNSLSGLHVIRIISVPDYPVVRWGVVVGDVVHSLRSALDHLAWQMANLHAQPAIPWRVHFPIAGTKTNFRRAFRKSQIPPQFRDFVGGFQPYKHVQGPDGWSGPYIHPLAHLQELSNDDKHKVITALLLLGTAHSFHTPIGTHVRPMHWADAGQPIEVGTRVGDIQLVPSSPLAVITGEVTPTPALAGPRDLWSTLDRLTGFIESVLRQASLVLP